MASAQLLYTPRFFVSTPPFLTARHQSTHSPFHAHGGIPGASRQSTAYDAGFGRNSAVHVTDDRHSLLDFL